MMLAFEKTPRPRQLSWGDSAARAHFMARDDFVPISCLDVCGCRKNALLTRKLLPVGSPLDAMEPVFVAGQYARPLDDFAWIWVDIDASHALYDGPHLYPLETVQALMREQAFVASADTLPFAWAPTRTFPSADLARAWLELERCCEGSEEEIKKAKPLTSQT